MGRYLKAAMLKNKAISRRHVWYSFMVNSLFVVLSAAAMQMNLPKHGQVHHGSSLFIIPNGFQFLTWMSKVFQDFALLFLLLHALGMVLSSIQLWKSENRKRHSGLWQTLLRANVVFASICMLIFSLVPVFVIIHIALYLIVITFVLWIGLTNSLLLASAGNPLLIAVFAPLFEVPVELVLLIFRGYGKLIQYIKSLFKSD